MISLIKFKKALIALIFSLIFISLPLQATQPWGFASATQEPSGWWSQAGYGVFWWYEGTEWIWHSAHGYEWIHPSGEYTSGGVYQWDYAMGCWMWTNSSYYPWLYSWGDPSGWLKYKSGGPGNRVFAWGTTGLLFGEQYSELTILNPGYENSFTGWTEVEPASISTSDKHSGTSSAKLTGSGARLEQTIAVPQNALLTLKAWILGSGQIGATVGSITHSESASGATEWTQKTVNFYTGSSTNVTVFAAYVSGDVRFDDWTLSARGGSSSSSSSSSSVSSSSSSSSSYASSSTSSSTGSSSSASSSTSSTSGSYPYNVLNLTNWKITIPYDGSDSGSDADEIKRPALETYSNTSWFWADADLTWVNFYCPAGAPTTSGSSNPRCELREMTSTGTSTVAWNMTTSNVYRMDGICKVTQTPSSGKVCFGQIHSTLDSYDDVIRVQVRLSGVNHILYVMGSCVNDTADDIRVQSVGSEIVYAIEASNSQVRLYLDGSETPVRTYENSMTKSPTNYFKAGNYLQSIPTSGAGNVKYRYVKAGLK
jgi:hypothetical protein